MADSPITVGGPYIESDDHVPNPTDMQAQFNTSGTGAHGVIEQVAPIFEVDKIKTALEIEAALDGDNDSVSSSKVILPSLETDNERATEALLEVTSARIERGVEIGGPGPAEREAELEGDEGSLAAVDQERSNAGANSTGTSDAGQHEGTVASDAGHDDTKRVGSGRRTAKKESDTGASESTADQSSDSGTSGASRSKKPSEG